MLLLLLAVVGAGASSSPPSCRLVVMGRQVRRGVPDQLHCSCSRTSQNYIGNINFVKVHLDPVSTYNRTVDITLRNCESLDLEINLPDVTKKNVNLRIRQTNSVKIKNISLGSAPDVSQSLILENVTNLYVTGSIQCFRCPESQGSLQFQLLNVSHVVFDKVNSSTPIKLTGRHLLSVDILQSYIADLPWPGIFLHNTSRVSISNSFFPGLVPKSISLNKGDEVNVSYNLMDVATALKLNQYNHINIKCNRKSFDEPLPDECLYNETTPAIAETSGVEPLYRPAAPEGWTPHNDTVLTTSLIFVDMYGFVCMLVAMLSVLVFLICYGCCASRPTKIKKNENAADEPALYNSPRLVLNPAALQEADRYSNSSKAHLAPPGPDVGAPYYVTVEGVRAEEVEGGIVCGSLTLGPAFNLGEDSRRAAASNTLKNQTFSKI